MKTWLKVLLTIFVTAGIVGYGTYYFVNKNAVKDKNNLQSQIDDLNEILSDAKTELATLQSTTNTTSSTSSSSTSSSNTTTTTDPTADWKTYTNTQYKYSVKYPATWQEKDFGMIDLENPSYVGFSQNTLDDASQSTIGIGFSNLNDTGYISKLKNTLGNFRQEATKINSINYTKVTGNNVTVDRIIYVTSWPNDSKVSVNLALNSITDENSEIFTKMITTFDFTD